MQSIGDILTSHGIMDWDEITITAKSLMDFISEWNPEGSRPIKIMPSLNGLELEKPVYFLIQDDNDQCVELPQVPYRNDNIMLRSLHLKMIEDAFGILPEDVKNWPKYIKYTN